MKAIIIKQGQRKALKALSDRNFGSRETMFDMKLKGVMAEALRVCEKFRAKQAASELSKKNCWDLGTETGIQCGGADERLEKPFGEVSSAQDSRARAQGPCQHES